MKNKSAKISSILVGVSGEYFVAAELSRRGYISSVTLKNTKGIDILVANESATKTIGIQVKTNQKNEKKWILNKKAEDLCSDNLFYVFVNLIGVEQLPEYYIFSSKNVAATVKAEHQNWLKTGGKNGQPRKDQSIRMFQVDDKTHPNGWNILEDILKL